MCSSDCFLAILAVLFPPIAVWVKRGICSADSIINLALLCLGYLPGLLHAWYIIATYGSDWDGHGHYESIEDGRNSRNVYYYSATYPSAASHTQPPYPGHHHHHHHASQSHSHSHSHCISTQPSAPNAPTRDYGTTTVNHQHHDNDIHNNNNNPPTETAAVEQSKPVPQPLEPHTQTGIVVDGMNGLDGASSSTGPPTQAPPSYSDVVKGDFKIQTS